MQTSVAVRGGLDLAARKQKTSSPAGPSIRHSVNPRPFRGIDDRPTQLSYYSGSVGSRLSTPWSLTQYTPAYRYINPMELMAMRNRSRELERNNAIADGMLSRAVENVVGEGFQHQSTTDDEDWNKATNDWWDGECESIDYNGLSWLEHQSLIYRSRLRDGDVLGVKLASGQIQGIEGDLIWSPDTAKGNQAIVDGILTDSGGRAVTYFITPYDMGGRKLPVPYAAKDVVFFARTKRLGQLRGEPCFAQTFTLFDQVDKWIEATIVQARMAACVGLAIIKKNAAAFNAALKTFPANPNAPAGAPPSRKIDFEPGMLPVFENGEEIQQLNPNQPNQSFPDNLVMMMRLAGLSLGMPLELVLLDFSRTNFASARASMLQAYRRFRNEQKIMIGRYLSPVRNWKIQLAIQKGKLKPNPQWAKHRFIGQPWPYLDPTKEAQANQMLIDQGGLTIGQLLQSQGHDFDTWCAQRKLEIAKMKAADIPILHHQVMQPFPAMPSAAVAPQPQPVSITEDNEDEDDDK